MKHEPGTRETRTRSPFSRRGALVVVATLSVAVGSSALRSRAETQPTAPPPPRDAMPVELVVLRQGAQYAVEEMHAGRIVSRRVSELGFERAGRLVEVTRDQGEFVEAGVVLARLDTRELEARRRERVAERDRISAELELARSTTGRREELHSTGVLSSQRYDETRYAQASLESQIAAATASIEHLDVLLELSELRAPFAGVLAERSADEGTVLQPGAPVLRLLESASPEVHIGVPPRAAAGLTTGETYRIEVEGQRLDARLQALLPDVDPMTRTVTAVLQIDAPTPVVRHGALARMALETEIDASGFWLPLEALAEGRRGLWTAFVAVPGDGSWTVERRPVELVHAESDRAYVRGTLYDGERVVASGVHRIAPGMQVRPVHGS